MVGRFVVVADSPIPCVEMTPDSRAALVDYPA
jgi:hypothetical protein